jgi:hypothetical protein
MRRYLLFVCGLAALISLGAVWMLRFRNNYSSGKNMAGGEMVVDTKYGFSMKVPKGWKQTDNTGYFEKNPGLNTVYKKIVIQSPDMDAHYTGGDFGTTIWNNGYQIDILLVQSNFTSLEDIRKEDDSCRQKTEIINSVTYLICGPGWVGARGFVKLHGVPGKVLAKIDLNSGTNENNLTATLLDFLGELRFEEQ